MFTSELLRIQEAYETSAKHKSQSINEHFWSKNSFASDKSSLSKEHATLNSAVTPSEENANSAATSLMHRGKNGDLTNLKIVVDDVELTDKSPSELSEDERKLVQMLFDDGIEFDGNGYETNVDERSELNHQISKSLAQSLKNHIYIHSGSTKPTLGEGTYTGEGEHDGHKVVITYEILEPISLEGIFPFKPDSKYHDETDDEYRTRRGELVKPNLPESTEVDEKRTIFTLEIFDRDNDEAIEDMVYAKNYYSMDDAIEDGKKAWKEYNDPQSGGRNVEVNVVAGEYELPSGGIYGEPTVVLEIGKDIIAKDEKGAANESKKVCESGNTIRIYIEDSPIEILRKKCWNCEELLADIESSGVEDEFDALAVEMFPRGAEMTEFNDWCRFDGGSIRQSLGIVEEEEEEDENRDA